MSEFNIVWRKYNLRDNPYFIDPLTISNDKVPITVFTGRDSETKKLISLINSGSERILIIGNAGVGKTSFVNYVRARAREGRFFSPSSEIELNYVMAGQEFLVSTLSSLYREIKLQNLLLSEETMLELEQIYSLTRFLDKKNSELQSLNFGRLKELFKRTVKEIVHPRHKGIIIHYDNIDNIEETEEIPKMFGEIRDVLLTDNVTFIFVGNTFLPDDIGYQQRVRQIFYFPPIEITELGFQEIKEILNRRIEHLSISENPEIPHTEEALKILFELYSGNIRHILRSLSACVLYLAPSNNPTKIDEYLLKEILVKKVKEDYLNGLTAAEKDVLVKMLKYGGEITPTELSKITHKAVQNISSFYLARLKRKTAVEAVRKEGRNIYYSVRPEIKWWLLETEHKEKRENKVTEIIDKKLTGFMA
ncbi:AAA family ATPase [Candidatus Woesearchaeota archaeon]|nr:AAA family ATPase [Candidatus Woesearchaeota archaeon]